MNGPTRKVTLAVAYAQGFRVQLRPANLDTLTISLTQSCAFNSTKHLDTFDTYIKTNLSVHILPACPRRRIFFYVICTSYEWGVWDSSNEKHHETPTKGT